RQKIRSMLAAHPDVEIVSECSDGLEAVAEIRRLRPDLVFLDIQMPGSDGFEVLRRLKGTRIPAIVFVTAHDEYATRAFDIEAIDYLLKPFDRRRFNESLRRARKRIEGPAEHDVPERLLAAIRQLEHRDAEHWTRFVVKVRDRMIFVPTAEIDWIESEGKYVRLHCGASRHLVREAISEVENRLDPREFARIHRRIIVNLRKVTEMYRGFGGDSIVVLSNGEKLTVSRRYWSQIRHLGGTK
ncbi:MAG TPA: LytTR family DNA-binding domain-containing protein, partial [Thermoanaerobaculia bacterium]|nr:LytTR family DNA-binding domain-containing protein [Thermoanaerobaculia bacterium]